MKMFIFSWWWIPGKLCCNTRDSTTQFQDPRLKWKIKGNTQNPIINQNDNLYLLNWKKIKWIRDAEGYKLSVVVSVNRIRIIKNCIANYLFKGWWRSDLLLRDLSELLPKPKISSLVSRIQHWWVEWNRIPHSK